MVRNPRTYGRLRTAAMSVAPSPGRAGEASTHLAGHELQAEPQREGDEDRREHQARSTGAFPLCVFGLQLPLTPALAVGVWGNWIGHRSGSVRRWRGHVIHC